MHDKITHHQISDIMANVLDFDFVVSEFDRQSRYYIHFWTNTLGKGINSIIPRIYGCLKIDASH